MPDMGIFNIQVAVGTFFSLDGTTKRDSEYFDEILRKILAQQSISIKYGELDDDSEVVSEPFPNLFSHDGGQGWKLKESCAIDETFATFSGLSHCTDGTTSPFYLHGVDFSFTVTAANSKEAEKYVHEWLPQCFYFEINDLEKYSLEKTHILSINDVTIGESEISDQILICSNCLFESSTQSKFCDECKSVNTKEHPRKLSLTKAASDEYFSFFVDAAIAIDGAYLDKSAITYKKGVAHLNEDVMRRWLHGNAQGWSPQEVGYGNLLDTGDIEKPGNLVFLDASGNQFVFTDGSVDQGSIEASFNCEFAGFLRDCEDGSLEAMLLHMASFEVQIAAHDKQSAAKLLEKELPNYFFLNIDMPCQIQFLDINGYTDKLGSEIVKCRACLFLDDEGSKFCKNCGSKF